MSRAFTQAELALLEARREQLRALSQQCNTARVELMAAQKKLNGARANYALVHSLIVSDFGEGLAPVWIDELYGPRVGGAPHSQTHSEVTMETDPDVILERTGVHAAEAINAATVLTRACHLMARSSGWWDESAPSTSMANPLHFSNKLCLIHSEISEAMEGDRKNLMDDKLPHRQMREVELADAVIRIFDLAAGYDLDLAGAIAEKLAYNANRADHKPEARKAAGGKTY